MKMLVLHTPKGGSGKSTLTREIATLAAKAGLKTAIADMDPQGTTSGWFQRRQNEAPSLVKLDPASLGANLRTLSAEFDFLVVDTPPASPTFIPALLTQADMVLVPVRPTPDDLLAAAAIAKSLGRHSQWAFVLSQVPPRTRLLASAVRQLAAIGRVAPVQITFRADYPAAAIDGSAAGELTGKASDEAAALYSYINSTLGNDDGKAT